MNIKKILIGLGIMFSLANGLKAIPLEQANSILQNRWNYYNLGSSFNYTVNTFNGPVVLSAYTDSTKATNDSLVREGGIDLESSNPTQDKIDCNNVGVFYKYFDVSAFPDSASFSDSVDAIIVDSLLGGSNYTSLNDIYMNASVKGDTVFLDMHPQNQEIGLYEILRKKQTDNEYDLIAKTYENEYKDILNQYGIFDYQVKALDNTGKVLSIKNIRINKIPEYLKNNQKIEKFVYFKNNLDELKKKYENKVIYSVDGAKHNFNASLPYGVYFAIDENK